MFFRPGIPGLLRARPFSASSPPCGISPPGPVRCIASFRASGRRFSRPLPDRNVTSRWGFIGDRSWRVHARHEIAVDRGIVPRWYRSPVEFLTVVHARLRIRERIAFLEAKKGPGNNGSGKRETRGTVLSIFRGDRSAIFENFLTNDRLHRFLFSLNFLCFKREKERGKDLTEKRKNWISVMVIRGEDGIKKKSFPSFFKFSML